jgi:hypothetical protein
MTMAIIVLGCLTAFLLFSLILICVHCIKMEKSILDITEVVESRVLEMYEVKK